MKLNLTRGQIIALGAGGIALLMAAAVGWLGLGSLMEKSDLAQQLAERRGKNEIADIIGKSGGIGETKKEITKLEQLASSLSKKEEAVLGPWRSATVEARGEGKDWAKDPNRWKDQLVKYNDEILRQSDKGIGTKSVLLGTNFYLGLEEYRQKSPREDQVGDLALQLSVSKRLVDLLFEAKKTAREGYPTPCLLLRLQGPAGQQAEGIADGKPRTKESGKSGLQRDRYQLDLACSPEVLYAYIHALVTNTYFFIPMNIALTNEKEVFPKRSELAAQFTEKKAEVVGDGENPSNVGKKGPQPLLKILAGDEKLKVNLQVDFVSFKGAAQDNKDAGKKGGP